MRAEFKQYNLFCLLDGHVGDDCASLCMKKVHPVLLSFLPKGHPPAEHTPQFPHWRAHLERAIATTFATLDNEFASLGSRAGSTFTLVMQFGWHLVVANVGDSRAVVATSSGITALTDEHRLQANSEEIERCRALGYTVASICPINLAGPADGIRGIGPLRLWPGGIALSRSMGDFSVGMATVAAPTIRHVQLPWEGVRLVIASDGVWDAFPSTHSALKYVRKEFAQTAAQLVAQRSVQLQINSDDASAIIVDIMPQEGMKFADVVPSTEKKVKRSLFSCLKPAHAHLPVEADPSPSRSLQVVGYTDMLYQLGDLGMAFTNAGRAASPKSHPRLPSLGMWAAHKEDAERVFNLFKNCIRVWCTCMLQPIPLPKYTMAEDLELQQFERQHNRMLKRSATDNSRSSALLTEGEAKLTSVEEHSDRGEGGGQAGGRYTKEEALQGMRRVSSEVADPLCSTMPSFVAARGGGQEDMLAALPEVDGVC